MDAQKKTAVPVEGTVDPAPATQVDKAQVADDGGSSLAWFDDEIGETPVRPRRAMLRAAFAGSVALCAAGAVLWHVPSVQDAGRSMLGLAPLAQHTAVARVARVPVQLPDIKLGMPASQIAATVGQTVSFPVSIENTAAVPQGSFVLVRGVPERSTLSSGTPFGAGTWKLDPSALSQLSLTIFNLPDTPPRIAVELLSGQGDVIARTEATVAAAALPAVRAIAAQPVPAREIAASPVTYPPLKAEAEVVRAERNKAGGERLAAPATSKPGRQTAGRGAPVQRPTLASNKQVAGMAQPQPKTAWKMNWNSVTYGR